MAERNLCHERGCPVACCRNVHGEFAARADFFKKAFPQAKRVNSKEELLPKVRDQELGVYFFEDQSWIYFSISGDCPNLTQDLNCRVHGQRYHPAFCRNMIIDSGQCEEARELYTINNAILQHQQSRKW